MPTSRNYRKEWLTYDSLPKRKKARAARGRARYALMKEGKVKVGDGKHVEALEKSMRLSEDVIRYLTVKQYGPIPAKRSPKTGGKNDDEKRFGCNAYASIYGI